MQRRFRLHRSEDIQRVRRTGKSYAGPLAVLIAAQNGLSVKRAAFPASRAVGTAVARNRTRRRLREAVRALWSDVPEGWDFLMVARARSAHVRYDELARAVRSLFRQAGWTHDRSRDSGGTGA
jgi:ribonuclease P protein component